MQQKGLADLLFYGVQRVQRRHRLLEDHRDPVAAHAAQRALRRTDKLLIVEADGARGMTRLRIGEQLENR